MSKVSKVVVLGGAGLIGAKVVARLRALGVEVVAASRRTGVDLVTGQGLAAAMKGAEAVVDASDLPSFDMDNLRTFFQTAGDNVLAAERGEGVRHHVTLSIVGVGTVVGNAYYDAKRVQEEVVEASGIPYTLARSTQFYEFIPTIVGGFANGDVVALPDAPYRPIAADDVGAALAQIAMGAPRNGPVLIAGPELSTFAAWFGRVFELTGDPRRAVADPTATYFGGRVADGSLVPAVVDYQGDMPVERWITTPAAKAALSTDRYADAAHTLERGEVC